MPEHAGPRFASLLRAWPPLGWLGDRWSDQRQALVVYPRPKHGALLRRPNGEVGDQQVAMSLPRFRGHPNSHESAIGGCHGKAEAEEAAIVLAGVQGGDGPVGAGEREEPRDDRPGARSHRDSAARMGAAG